MERKTVTTSTTKTTIDGAKTTVEKKVVQTTSFSPVAPAAHAVDTSKPYGRFESPISTDSFAGAAIGLGKILVDKQTGRIYHLEGRPAEKGRTALVAHTETGFKDILPEKSVRSSVHEYGGGSAAVLGNLLVFVDTRSSVFVADMSAEVPVATPITPESSTKRYADFDIHPSLKYVIAIQENHLENGTVENCLVAIHLDTGAEPAEPSVIATGRDFYTYPRFNAAGTHMCWVEWDLPEMPWTKSSLHIAQFWGNTLDGVLLDKRVVAEGNFSVSQPLWSTVKGAEDELIFAQDDTGFYNLYKFNMTTGATTPLLESPYNGDFSGPDWTLGTQTFDFLSNGKIITAHSNQDGTSSISLLDPNTQSKTPLLEGHVVRHLRISGSNLYMVSGTSVSPTALAKVCLTASLDGVQSIHELRVSTEGLAGLEVSDWISVAEPIEFPTEDGLMAYGFFYPPKNPNHKPPKDSDLPPLVVDCHGGPTSASESLLNPTIQYWTSRGWAVFQVNYGGSTGYGREYRDRLNGTWGIVDVNDACNGALYLASTGRVDATKMCVTGGSAGGYTTLAIAAYRPDVFAVGASKFGICDLKSLAELTHKFESKYLDLILGTANLTPEEVEALYYARSPIHSIDKIKTPLLILQGSEDRVVPKNQAELMVEAIKSRGGVVEYELFEGEGHGWRKSENIKRAVEVEMEFYLTQLKI
ncbi:Dipeptidyl aminopeptidase [Chytriomyces hyalinus]|nr:Dipeptidyl aminopeptidase [Chytriomyces hyalinus]